MNLLKKIVIFSISIVFQNTFGLICVNATANYQMFGSVLRSNILKNPFIMAFQKEHFKNYKIYSANNDTQLVNQIQSITQGKCSVVVGLFTSQDCLIAGPILKKNKTIGLSPSCADNHISNFFPYLYTAVPQLSDFSKSVAKYINSHKDTGKIFAFYQPSDVYSVAGFHAFKRYCLKKIIRILVNSEGNFNIKKLEENKKNASTMIFFTYPLPSAQILVTLDTNKLVGNKVNIIGASSWVFDVSVFKPIKSILAVANHVITPSPLNETRIKASHFARVFLKRYHRRPDVVEVLTYDTTRLAIQCYRNASFGGLYNKKLFLQCIMNNQYRGIFGHVSFKADSSFATRKIYLINFLNWIS